MNVPDSVRMHASAVATGLIAATLYALVAVFLLDGTVRDHWLELLGLAVVFYAFHLRRSRRGRDMAESGAAGL